MKRIPVIIPRVWENNYNPYGYIYVTTNLVNRKQYVGQHSSRVPDRYYLGSGTILLLAIEKYGRKNFISEPIDWAESKEELDQKEIYWIDFLGAVEDDSWYNLIIGGTGGDILTEEQKRQMSVRNSGEGNPRSGIKVEDSTKQKISDSLTGLMVGEKNPFYGHTHTDEYKARKSESQRQYLMNNPQSSEKLRQSTLGKIPLYKGQKLPEEWCENMRGPRHQISGEKNPNFGNTWSEEKKHISSEKVTGIKNPHHKEIVRLSLNYEFIESYDLIKDAIMQGYGSWGIQNCLQGRSKKVIIKVVAGCIKLILRL